MNEYLEQSILNCINSFRIPLKYTERPLQNHAQWIVDEDDQVYYMEGYVNGIHSRWTINKAGLSYER
jgi:phage major head subunit gpT-like protein